MMRERDAEAELNLPHGFRFHPTDEELVVYYLCRKATYQCLPVPIIAEIDLYKYDPWQLPGIWPPPIKPIQINLQISPSFNVNYICAEPTEKALFGTKEWYFFTPRDRKYPNGLRPNRAAGSGYWKATGADKPIKPTGSLKNVGIKKALVFYSGKAPRGVKTNWIMHEYRLAEPNRHSRKGSLRLDDWVLCRIYNKKNIWEQIQKQKEPSLEDSFEAIEDSTGSSSFRTTESDVDNDPVTELDDLVGPQGNPYQALGSDKVAMTDTNGSSQMVECMKEEENDWFTNLNLEELQNSPAVFEPMHIPDITYQDYYLSSLCSPQWKTYHPNQLPF
ncbi:hypothetical protein HHK36_017569 [Tetracentron sinense]|uniref:NAC domain-containing protein n=1 Tax=Tetracentron sinense TaxID=13715 RepID=A0A835D9J2_TETSI|nr:hypothetical protein HHK36_017569 [Tetracentron sinense]